jgi:16S rRNA (guanine1516-N2)-methyltransferase
LTATVPLTWAAGFHALAETISGPLVLLGECAPAEIKDHPFVLYLDSQGLGLCATGKRAPGPVRCDFVSGATRHRRLYGGGKSQAIAKAIGIKVGIRPKVADLTAGLGGDGFVLAGLGCKVTLVERNPVIYLLLADGLRRARDGAADDPDLAAILGHLSLVQSDGKHWLQGLSEGDRPDVVYLDPMFPDKQKKAQVNKAMQAFQQVVGRDEDAAELLPLALAVARHRVVVKRPVQAPFLNNMEPGYSLKGKAVRFDIYPLKKMTAG